MSYRIRRKRVSTAARFLEPVHRTSFFDQARFLLRYTVRYLFGRKVFDRCGHFVDADLSLIVSSYAYFTLYPTGDQNLEKHSRRITSSVISCDGRYLFTGSQDTSIIRWDLRRLSLIQHWKAHESDVNCLAYNGQRFLLASGGDDHMVRVWNSLTGKLTQTFEGHTAPVLTVAIDPDAKYIISGSYDRTIRMWPLNNHYNYNTSDSIHGCVSLKKVEFSRIISDDKYHKKAIVSTIIIDGLIISGSEDKSIRIHNPHIYIDDGEGDDEEAMKVETGAPLSHVCANCDASYLACTRTDRDIIVCQWPTLKSFATIPFKSLVVCFHPSVPHVLAIGCDNESVVLYNVVHSFVVARFKFWYGFVRDLCFTPDGTRLISVGDDIMVHVWDLSKLAF